MARSSRFFRDSFESILIAIFLALLVRSYVVTGYRVPTSTMAPTLLPGDFIFASRFAGGFRLPLSQKKFGVSAPERGDLVVFTFVDQPRVPYVKRVMGLPGDRIQMIQGELLINDVPAKYRVSSHEVLSDIPGYDQLEILEESWGEMPTHHVVRNKVAKTSDFGPLIVPEDEIFVLGDHRDASDDSRYWGTVPYERIDAKVLLIWLSLDWEKTWGAGRFPSLRTDRVIKSVH